MKRRIGFLLLSVSLFIQLLPVSVWAGQKVSLARGYWTGELFEAQYEVQIDEKQCPELMPFGNQLFKSSPVKVSFDPRKVYMRDDIVYRIQWSAKEKPLLLYYAPAESCDVLPGGTLVCKEVARAPADILLQRMLECLPEGFGGAS